MGWVALTNEIETQGIARLRDELRSADIAHRTVRPRRIRVLVVLDRDLRRARAIFQRFVTDADLLAMGEL